MADHGGQKLSDIDGQMGMARVRTVFRAFSFGSPTQSRIGGTDFEDRELNSMLDMIDNAKPADLTATARELASAAGQIKKIGNALKEHVGHVVWEGDSGESFRDWGDQLAKSTLKLGDYAKTAATQLHAAGEGLSDAKSAMPPRDTRLLARSPKDFPDPKRTESNEEYAEAVKVDKHREEAIVQMNKVSSHYQVSHDTIAIAPEPVFHPMKDVGVPQPVGWIDPGTTGGNSASNLSSSGVGSAPAPVESGVADGNSVSPAPQHAGSSGHATPEVAGDLPVGTAIDAASSPAAPAAAPSDSSANAAAQMSSPGTRSDGPNMGAMPMGQVGRSLPGAARSMGEIGGKPVGQRSGMAKSNPMGRGSRAGAEGIAPRQGPVGKSGAVGPRTLGRQVGSPGSGAGLGGRPGPVNRGAIGRPSAGAGTQRPGSARGGRGDGIVGGNPSKAGTGSAPQRGTAPGGERGRAALRNPVGARPGGQLKDEAKTKGFRARSADGGVSAKARGSLSNRAKETFTQGGSGLTRPGMSGTGNNNPRRKKRDKSVERPDYLTEELETWTQGRSRPIPPVVE